MGKQRDQLYMFDYVFMILNYCDLLDRVLTVRKLNCPKLYGQVRSVMKIRQDNDITDQTGVLYVENDSELLWSIRSSVICDEY